MLEVEERYKNFGRHERIRIEQWSKKLWQVTTNPAWKRSRNLYAMLLTDWVINGKLVKPFTLVPPDSHLPVLNKAEVSSQLSLRFKAYQKTMHTKQIHKKVVDFDINAENENPQLINIQANIRRPYSQLDNRTGKLKIFINFCIFNLIRISLKLSSSA